MYLDYKFSSNQSQLKDKTGVRYYKCRYIGNLSNHIKNKLAKVSTEFCKENFNIKFILHFSYKDPIPNDLKPFPVYKFTCVGCSSRYIGKTSRLFETGIEKHIKKDDKSHIFKHLHSTATRFDSYNSLCF